MKNKTKYSLAALFGVLAIAWIALIKCVDVAAIGPAGTSVGLSRLNQAVHDLTGVHMLWYDITDWLGILAVLAVAAMALLGLVQLIRRRSLLKVDREILCLGGLYLVIFLLYVFFEKVIVNYRPMLMPDGEGIEASFPSSHTVLSCVILGSGLILLKKYTKKNKTVQLVLTVLFAVMLALIVAGRLISGVHWFTDILGGILLSVALLNAYQGLLKLWKKSDKRKR